MNFIVHPQSIWRSPADAQHRQNLMAEREVLNDIGLIFRFFKCRINELGYCTRLKLLCGEKHSMCLPQAYDQPARLLGQCWPTFKKTLAVLALQRMTHGRLISMYEPLDEPENSWMAVCHATKQMNDNPKYVSSVTSLEALHNTCVASPTVPSRLSLNYLSPIQARSLHPSVYMSLLF